jgi:hypothetical protein
VCGPPKSSGQVSNATHGVMAMRAPSGHLIGDLFGLTFIMPPRSTKISFSHATVCCACQHSLDALLEDHLVVEQFFSNKRNHMDYERVTGDSALT